jgi:formylmethanofuran dehydrogenase subunit A
MSRKARTDTMLEINKAVMRRTTLANIYREYTFGEIATVTRAATAKVLGLEEKGHLGPGADGDVSVYQLDPTTWRPSMYTDLEKAFSRAFYTIKAGDIVVKDGEVMATPLGTTFWADARVPEDVEAEFMKDLEEEFRKHYTVSLRNYPVEDAYLPTQRAIHAVGGK